MNLIDLYSCVVDFVQLESAHLTTSIGDVQRFTVRADHTATEDLQLSFLADQTEFHGVPKDSAVFLEDGRIRRSGADFSIRVQEASKDGMGMHRDMAKGVMEDI